MPTAPAWGSLSGPWKGLIREVFGNPVWKIHLDLRFRPAGDFTGDCTLVSLGDAERRRCQIRGFCVPQAGGPARVVGAIVDGCGFLFFPVLDLSTRRRRPRLDGVGELTSVPDDFDPGKLLAAARKLGPDESIKETRPGLKFEWYDSGTYELRRLSTADQAREHLRDRVRQAVRAAAPAGTRARRTCVSTRRAPEGGWVAEAWVSYTSGDGPEEGKFIAFATSQRSRDALEVLLAQLVP